MGDLKCVCSFQQYSKKECNHSARNKSAGSIFIVKNCSSSTKEHLRGCFKTSRDGVEEDGKLCLAHVGLFEECGDLTICPEHRNEFAMDGGQVKSVNILIITANRNRTEGYPGRCREKYTYTSMFSARLDKVTHCSNILSEYRLNFKMNTG